MMCLMDDREVMAVLCEPTRFRIVELLAEAPRTVGEVAELLGALQPQTTKHLQTLAVAELITVHRLGRRRVATIRPDTLRRLAGRLETLAESNRSDSVVERYGEAIDAEDARVAAGVAADRIIHVLCDAAVPVERAWRAWTTAAMVRRWWAPEHFSVARCVIRAVPGGTLRIVLREADGAEYTAAGTFVDLQPQRRLRFELAPLDDTGAPLFAAAHDVTFTATDEITTIAMSIAITQVAPGANAALAGVQLGWQQTFDRLTAFLVGGDREGQL